MQNMSQEKDLDVISRAHIHRAIQRAENDYGSYSSKSFIERTHNNSLIASDKLSNGPLNKPCLNAFQLSNLSYITGIQSVSALTSKEIKSSVNRSRRWSGRENQLFKRDYDVVPATNFVLGSRTSNSNKVKHKSKIESENNAESAYHRTVYDILSENGPKSSYDHVAKVMAHSPSLRQNDITLTTSSRNSTAPRLQLPHIQAVKDKTDKTSLSNKPHLLRVHLDTSKSDWALRYASNANPAGRSIQKIENNQFGQLWNKTTSPSQYRNLNLSKVCQVLSGNSTKAEKTDSGNKTLHRRQQAHRAIQNYYKREDKKAKSKFVVVHLPNAALPSSNDEYNVSRPPSLIMRSGKDSAFRSMLSDVEIDKARRESYNTLCTASESRIKLRPFLCGRQRPTCPTGS